MRLATEAHAALAYSSEQCIQGESCRSSSPHASSEASSITRFNVQHRVM